MIAKKIMKFQFVDYLSGFKIQIVSKRSLHAQFLKNFTSLRIIKSLNEADDHWLATSTLANKSFSSAAGYEQRASTGLCLGCCFMLFHNVLFEVVWIMGNKTMKLKTMQNNCMCLGRHCFIMFVLSFIIFEMIEKNF